MFLLHPVGVIKSRASEFSCLSDVVVVVLTRCRRITMFLRIAVLDWTVLFNIHNVYISETYIFLLNRVSLLLCDIINYKDVISAASSYD